MTARHTSQPRDAAERQWQRGPQHLAPERRNSRAVRRAGNQDQDLSSARPDAAVAPAGVRATPIAYAKREPGEMQAQAWHVDRRCQQRGIGTREQRRHGSVGDKHRPTPVERRGRMRHVSSHRALDRLAPFAALDRRAAGPGTLAHIRSKQQSVAFPQRHFELLARRSTISRLEAAQPVSTKLRYRFKNLRFGKLVDCVQRLVLAPDGGDDAVPGPWFIGRGWGCCWFLPRSP